MNRTTVLTVLLGIAATAGGFLLYYGCIFELGFGCPGSTFRPAGLLLQGLGEGGLVVGLVVPRAMRTEPKAARKPKRETRREPEPEPDTEPDTEPEEPELETPSPKPTAARAAAPARPRAAASPGAQLFFCPECGRHYRTVTGRYCPVDATELRPVAK